MRRFGIKDGKVIDFKKRRAYRILRVDHCPYLPGLPKVSRQFAIKTKEQTFLREGLWVR